jgi:hypothetical protein
MNRQLLVQIHLFMESFGGQVTFEMSLGLESEAYYLSCFQQLPVRSFWSSLMVTQSQAGESLLPLCSPSYQQYQPPA